MFVEKTVSKNFPAAGDRQKGKHARFRGKWVYSGPIRHFLARRRFLLYGQTG